MLKLRTLFSGIGSPEAALEKLGIEYELVDFCEFDKYASTSYCAIHNVEPSKNLGDVSKVDETKLEYADLMVWGFPCQDISVAGNQKGIVEGETRSGLYHEGFRILKATMPKYSIIENVKNLCGEGFMDEFNSMLKEISALGYNNYWEVLNAKDYGIPQNRERVFIVSIRKDVDEGNFMFPVGFDNGLRLKDLLEDEVDEKYYITNEKVDKLLAQLDYENIDKQACDMTINNPKFTEICNCIKARYDAWISNQRSEGIGVCVPCLTSQDRHGIVMMDVPQTVCVRKYDVNIDKLKDVLRSHKHISNKEIAEHLDKPITLVEHWFRKDDCFSIPDADVWNELKSLLDIQTNEFDKSIMTFEEKDGVFEKANRVYCEDGIAPTLTSASADEKIFTKSGVIQVGNYMDDKRFENPQCGRVYDAEGCSPTLNTMGGGDRQPKVAVIEPQICDYRYDEGIRIRKDNKCPCLPSSHLGTESDSGQPFVIENAYRIRKLTPKECFRLMGFTDEQFQKAVDVGISNSQLYKQAGNSIAVDVLYYIFRNLLQGVPKEEIETVGLQLRLC